MHRELHAVAFSRLDRRCGSSGKREEVLQEANIH